MLKHKPKAWVDAIFCMILTTLLSIYHCSFNLICLKSKVQTNLMLADLTGWLKGTSRIESTGQEPGWVKILPFQYYWIISTKYISIHTPKLPINHNPYFTIFISMTLLCLQIATHCCIPIFNFHYSPIFPFLEWCLNHTSLPSNPRQNKISLTNIMDELKFNRY